MIGRDEEDYEQEWLAAQSNPKAIWSKDQYGEDIVSLLQTTEASAGRRLAHSKGVARSTDTDADDIEAAFTGATQCVFYCLYR